MNTSVSFPRLGSVTFDPATAAVLETASDIVLVVTADGVVHNVHSGAERAEVDNLLNARFCDQVAPGDAEALDLLLSAAGTKKTLGPVALHHVPSLMGETAVKYMAHGLGPDGGVMLIGRAHRLPERLLDQVAETEIMLSRDSVTGRETRARYRMIFQSAPEGLVVADPASGRIDEINVMARRLAGREGEAGVGRALRSLVSRAERGAIEHVMAEAREGRDAEATVTLMPSGLKATVRTQVFRAFDRMQLLVRLSPLASHDVDEPARPKRALAPSLLGEVPEPIVIVDGELIVLWANAAFHDVFAVGSDGPMVGRSMVSVLDASELVLSELVHRACREGQASTVGTALSGAMGSLAEWDVTAVSVGKGDAEAAGLMFHGHPSRVPSQVASQDRRSGILDLVGRAPLRDMVRETTDVIERACIEAALNLTGDNRAAAAETLGLSRQGLYSKMRRFGIE